MTGLQKLCKAYGRLNVTDSKGNNVVWIWDYANGKPRLESEMTKQEIIENERIKYETTQSPNS